jgi:hypothetical protein
VSFDEFLAGQDGYVQRVRRLPEFNMLIPLLDQMYARALEIFPATGGQAYFGRLMLVSHRGLFSAGATICRAQPDDAAGVTRRVVEAALTALAIKHDPENFKRWAASEQRVERWKARLEGRKPKPLNDSVQYPKDHPTVDWLRRQVGVLSDFEVHFTPEFLSSRCWEYPVHDDPERGLLKLKYFEQDPRELADALRFLASTHAMVLDAFDECLDGAFSRDNEWRETRAECARRGQALSARRRAAGTDEPGPGPLFDHPATH